MQADSREHGVHRLFRLLQRPRVFVNCVDGASWSDEIGQSQRKGSLATAQVSPGATVCDDTFAQQTHMILMIHESSSTGSPSICMIFNAFVVGQGPGRKI